MRESKTEMCPLSPSRLSLTKLEARDPTASHDITKSMQLQKKVLALELPKQLAQKKQQDERDEEKKEEDEIEYTVCEEEELLLQLIQCKKDLQSKLSALERRAMEFEQQNPHHSNLPQQRNLVLVEQKEEERHKTNAHFLEEIQGVSVQSLEEAESYADGSVWTRVTLQILEEHLLEIVYIVTAAAAAAGGGAMLLQSAHFLNQQNHAMYLPQLDDLVQHVMTGHQDVPIHFNTTTTTNITTAEEGILLLVEHARGRIQLWKERLAEIEYLIALVDCRVQICRNITDPDDDLFQKVIVQFAVPAAPTAMIKTTATLPRTIIMTATLRITPNCPRVRGGVFLESLKGDYCSSSPKKLLLPRGMIQRATAYVQGQQINLKSPVDMIQTLKQYIHDILAQQRNRAITTKNNNNAYTSSTIAAVVSK